MMRVVETLLYTNASPHLEARHDGSAHLGLPACMVATRFAIDPSISAHYNVVTRADATGIV